MTGNFSIRTKITVWFSVALILIVAITYLVILAVSDQVIQKTVRDSLIETVENNVGEIAFFHNTDDADLTNGGNPFLWYKEGVLKIDDDFLDEVNQVYTALYLSDGSLMYGENPIAREASRLTFKDSQIQRISVRHTQYYIFDRKLTAKGLEGLWLRGVVSEAQGEVQMAAISRTSLVLLPTLVLFTIIGGYLIAGRMLRPIRKISDSAAQIRRGGDLKMRIEVGKGRDELHQLADQFNGMFERLDSAFQMERQFTSDASHELRTPLTVIMAQCEFALEQERRAEEYREALVVVERQGQRMSRLINDLLDFTRLELRSDPDLQSDVDFTVLVESVCQDMALIRENHITLEVTAEPSVHCMGNRHWLARLLSNLISNAYRYGKEHGHILVSLKTENGTIALSVRDDGVGIPKEEQSKIFERFYQADNSHSGVGTGLGLAMVKEIARFHGGEISVESEPGVGSVFTFRFPPKNIS